MNPVRILASVAIPLSILPLLGAGLFWISRDEAAKPAAARSSACHPSPAPAVPIPVAIRVPPHPAAVPVIAYNGVALGGSSPAGDTVTREQLARDLSSVRAAGFTAISAATYRRFVAGNPVRLPPHPVLITFGGNGATTYCGADAILRRTGLRAVILSTAAGRSVKGLTADELRQIRTGRRWDVVSRAGQLHVADARAGRSRSDRLEVGRGTTVRDLLHWLRREAVGA